MIEKISTKENEKIIKKIEKFRNYKITKSNDFIRNARSNLTLLQSKIITFIISQIEPDEKDFKYINFYIGDFCDICGIKKTGMYAYIKRTLKDLRDKSFWVQTIDQKGIIREETFSWIEKVILTPNSGNVEIKFSEDLRPYLLDLKSNFTSYEAFAIYDFEGQNTAWFYDNVASFVNIGYWTISIDEIRKQTMSSYKNYKDLHRRIISPSINDINKHSPLTVTYNTIKKGRSVEKIKFLIQYKTSIEMIEYNSSRIKLLIDKQKNKKINNLFHYKL